MTSRRQLLRGVAGTLSVFGGLRWGGLVAPADAQSNDETASDSDASGDDGSSSADNEDDPSGLPGYTVGQIYLRYEEHVGITTFVELENESEQNNERVRLKADAVSANDTLGTDDTWKDIPATFERTIKLRLDNVFDLYNAVDNISEFVIRGRVPNGEYTVLAAFSGRAFRKGIEKDGPATPDGGADAAVEVQPETTDEANNNGGQSGDAETAGESGSDEPTADESTASDAGTEPTDPTNQTGVDVSNPDDVVDIGGAGGDDGGSNDGGGDDGGDNESGGGGGLLETLSFRVFGG
ncbi:hypothetical protein DM826_03605 [Halonotius aquaticus]|uniref:Uncharacterized protein n=1 Tax=Halonotius aquaticus TaxID=2216978 RepID=A0A3A6PXU4_9EURY|nr:hypothetical protein [Halonotius aquaticus]RJX44172.1 hypothetical protein DM826_03605 [Halonotius aquaticus]